jgi:hypothetical protein
MQTPQEYDAVVTFTPDSLARQKQVVSSYADLLKAQNTLEERIGEVKQQLAKAIAEAKAVADHSDVLFADDFSDMVGELDVSSNLNETLEDLKNYGYFVDGRFNFAEDVIELKATVESAGFPRMNGLTELLLSEYDPESGELTLRASIFPDPRPEHWDDPEFIVRFVLKPGEGPLEAAAHVTDWR